MKIEFTFINRLGEFKLEPFEIDEVDALQMIKWFQNSDMENLKGKILNGDVGYGIVLPSALLKESILKWREIKE